MRPSAARLERAPLAHLLELALRLHLLREQRGLDAVEETFEPADELGLRDAQLGVARRVARERQRDVVELLAEVVGEDLLELVDRALVDLLQRAAAGVVERRAPRLVEQRPDHRRDADELRRPRDLLAVGAALVRRATGVWSASSTSGVTAPAVGAGSVGASGSIAVTAMPGYPAAPGHRHGIVADHV